MALLSLGIKNSILVILIVLILHVLIKNAIIDKTLRTKREGFVDNRTVDKDKATVPVPAPSLATESIPAVVDAVEDQEQKPDCKGSKGEVDANASEAELLKFVYGDDENGGDLAAFFKGNDVTADVKGEIEKKMSCPVKKMDDNSLPLSTTCDPKFDKLPSTEKKVRFDCDLPQNISNMRLKEYEDENAMNGGALYGNLSAYDDDALNFEEYKCTR